MIDLIFFCKVMTIRTTSTVLQTHALLRGRKEGWGALPKSVDLEGCYMYPRASLGTYPRSRDTVVFRHAE
jgi:hypothetical protein